jgi:hypothetical protein
MDHFKEISKREKMKRMDQK